jgi:hypothetical protein
LKRSPKEIRHDRNVLQIKDTNSLESNNESRKMNKKREEARWPQVKPKLF